MRNLLATWLLLANVSLAFAQADTIPQMVTGHGRWGMGAETGPYSGVFFSYGEIKPFIHHGLNANISVYAAFRRLRCILKMGGITQARYVTDEGYSRNEDFYALHFEFGGGYELLRHRRINFIPMASAGLVQFHDLFTSQISSARLNRFTWSLSAAIDLKLHAPALRRKRQKLSADELKYGEYYWYLRLLAGIYPGYYNSTFVEKGGMYFFNASIGKFIRPPKTYSKKRDRQGE